MHANDLSVENLTLLFLFHSVYPQIASYLIGHILVKANVHYEIDS